MALRISRTAALATLLVAWLAVPKASAQEGIRDDEIVANLAGGRVIVHVAGELIIFAAIDKPVETKSIPPRVLQIDGLHVGVLFGASEWQEPADPKPVRLDRDFKRLIPRDRKYGGNPDQSEPDLEDIGLAFLERLRPLVSQLHHKLNFSSEDPLFEVVLLGYSPGSYDPEVWQIDYFIEQSQIPTRNGDFWQTKIQRPRFTQLYPPEGKHSPRTFVEVRYPDDRPGQKTAAFGDLLQGNDPRFAPLRNGDPRFAKVIDAVDRGQAQKANPKDATDFLRAAIPVIYNDAGFILGTFDQQHGFDWVVAPEEPVEKVQDDKNRPPEAPTLRRRPNL